MNADVTAENKPDYTKPHGEYWVLGDFQSPTLGTRQILTKMRVVFRSSSCLLSKSRSCSSISRWNLL